MERTSITPEIMKKVWKLHTNSVDDILISETLGISSSSAKRIINLMTKAKNGEDIDSIGGSNHKKQKDFAKEFFGIKEKQEEKQIEEQAEQQTEKQNADDSTFREFAVRVLFALEYQNKLLAKLCAAWGCEEE